MAAVPSRFPAWFITFVFFLLTAYVSSSLAQCVDGTYEHDGRTCCKCAAGQYLVKHCTTDANDRKCEPCESGKFNSHPNYQLSCDLCTSCSHPNANLEEEEACTPARDAKCRCKKDHYCGSGEEICKLCHPCETCPHGIKIPCQGKNNTVCSERNHGGMIAGVVFCIIAVLAVAAGIVWFLKKRKRRPDTEHQSNGNVVVEVPLLDVPQDVDLQPHLPDIADLIGWKDMKRIAMRSNISNAQIDSVQQNNPNDAQEQTLELLKIYVEREGRKAAENLVQMLEKSGLKDRAEKVVALLRGSTS